MPLKKIPQKTRHWYRIVLYGIVFLTLLFFPGQNIYELQPLLRHIKTVNSPPDGLPVPAPYPVNRDRVTPPSVTATGAMIVDVASGVSLYEKNADAALSPASTTKLMTALVILDRFHPEDVITVNEISSESRTMGLVIGEQLTVESLLYGLLVHSANDAAFALASAIPGGTTAFISLMNEKAQSLGMNATHFTNPAGFEDLNHRMSVRDLSRLSLMALKNPLIARIASTRTITVSDTQFTRFHDLITVNDLLGKIPGLAGLKTGYTRDSGECFVAYIVKPQARLLVIVLGSQDRFKESVQLTSWALSSFTWEIPAVLTTSSNGVATTQP